MYENVFVLCTGRCGSVTFIDACKHIKNYSSGHETRSGYLDSKRMAYPRFDIEADNRLSWLLGRLETKFGGNAFYVHLVRNENLVAQSFAQRKGGIMAAYQGNGILMGCWNEKQEDVAKDYIETVTSNICSFLKDKLHKVTFHLEKCDNRF